MCFFSLITVCLNPGEKLRTTLESALNQTCGDFEVIIKDGGSKDGSIEQIRSLLDADKRLKLFTEKDTGIYDAMNQAVVHAQGKYVFFLNCGDSLYNEKVLERVKLEIEAARAGGQSERAVYYGKVFSGKNQVWIVPAPQINGFTCYRNVPCHQACFYSAELCKEKPFETKYKIRGDYEHFLWCYYRGKAGMQFMDLPVAEYEGGGYSETKENLKRSKKEHREITELYMERGELFKYRLVMALTLAPLRTFLSESKAFSGIYSKLIGMVYRRH